MSDHLNIADFLLPVNLHEISHHEEYKDGQLGKVIDLYDEQFPDLDEANVVLLGCGEQRGSGLIHGQSEAPDIIRRHFYSLYYWQPDVKIADIGNIKAGSFYNDSHTSFITVVQALISDAQTAIIRGG